MGIFGKKNKVIPNYRTVPSENGPVIDVFCLNAEGYNTINADDNLLFLSGMTYWKMKLSAYGCNTDPDVARCNASRFFSKLWDNKYYERQPLVGWYIALYAVYHDNTWSDIARQAMKVFCESIFQQPKLHTMEAWYLSMMYTSLCGGSIDDVVQWLHKLLENNISKKLEGMSLVMPVLQHYKVLQGIVQQVPFTPPEVGGTLGSYWDYLADKYMCEEATLEATLMRLFLAHSPYKCHSIATADNTFMLDPEEEAEKVAVKKEAEVFNKAAKQGNSLALSFVCQTNWVYETTMNKTKYPSFDNLVLENDDYIRKNRGKVFLQLYSNAKSISDRITSTGLALQHAEDHFAKGLYLVSTGENYYDEMKKAATYAESLYSVNLPEGKLNAAIRAAACISLAFKEVFPFLTKADLENTSKVEKLAISCRNKPTELKFRKLGLLLRDGFMGMHPQPELWDKFRFKAFDTAKAYGITKYVLDDGPAIAEMQFRSMIENSDNFWSEKDITGAWLGLAWLRYSKEDYSDLSELVEYLGRYEKFDRTLGHDAVNSYIKAIRDNDLMGIEPLAEKLTQNKDVHKGDPILKDMGRLIARYLGCRYEQKMENCKDEIEKLALMTKVVDVEMLYAGYAPRLFSYILMGLDMKLVYFYSLLECREVFDAVYANTNLETMLGYVNAAIDNGCDLKEELAELNHIKAEMEEKQRRAEIRLILKKESEKKNDFTASKHKGEVPSLIDVLMDLSERESNEEGLTNEELWNLGRRGYLEHEKDKTVRDFLKNPFK